VLAARTTTAIKRLLLRRLLLPLTLPLLLPLPRMLPLPLRLTLLPLPRMLPLPLRLTLLLPLRLTLPPLPKAPLATLNNTQLWQSKKAAFGRLFPGRLFPQMTGGASVKR